MEHLIKGLLYFFIVTQAHLASARHISIGPSSVKSIRDCYVSNHDFFFGLTLLKETETKLVINIGNDETGECKIKILDQVTSGKNFVALDLNDLGEEFKEKKGQTYNAHTHISANAEYFILESSKGYLGEIKFSSFEEIQSLAINKNLYDKSVNKIRSNFVPGFNLSPPSTTDFKFLIHQMEKHPFLEDNYSMIVTSGGFWIYRISSEDKARVLEFLEKVDFLANVYKIVYDPKVRVATKRAAKHLLKISLKKQETNDWFSVWKKAALLTRSPYSKEALNSAVYENNFDLLNSEYRLKIKAANSLAVLLRQHGVDAAFISIKLPAIQAL